MITSLQNETIKDILKLKQKKHRDQQDRFLVEGFHLVDEARKHGYLLQVITTLDDSFDEETLYVSQHIMEKLAFTKTPQPIMAVCRCKESAAIIANKKRYLLLDRVQDPGNVGTMIRTALAFGYDQVILSPDCVDIYNDKVIRATQGALFKMDICQMDLAIAITTLRNQGVIVCATSLHDAIAIDHFQAVEKMAIVLGNEGQGVSQFVMDMCQERLYIPIHTVESLNVSVAAAIAMYHFKG